MQSGLPCIALGPFVRALAQKSSDDFGVFKDQLPGDIPQERRNKLLQFLPMARHKLIRFLVLIRYLKHNHSRIKALEKIHETINKSEHQYRTTCNNFDELYTEMVTTMEPIWDIETALHILTLGSYRNLPQIIDNSIQINKNNNNLSPTFISSTIHKLNNALRVRLLSDNIPPQLKLLNIEQGMVFMIAKNEFEIAISLRMRPKSALNHANHEEDENHRIHWSLFKLKLLLKASINTENGDKSKYIVTDHERDILLLSVNEKMKLSHSPLQIMYKELSTFCDRLQFAVLIKQINHILYRYGEYNIRIERKQHKSITIRMWKFAAKLPNDTHTILDDNILNDNDRNADDMQENQKQKQTQKQKEEQSIIASSFFNTNISFNMEALDESERKENAIKSQFRISLSVLYEEQGLNITYYPKLHSFSLMDLLCVHPNNLNLPKLIHNFTVLHCNYRFLYLLNKLIELDKEYRITPTVKTNAKEILFAHGNECNLTQKDKIKIMRNLQAKHIEICLSDGKYVEIYINGNNGQIMLEKTYNEFLSNKALIFEKHLKIYNDKINKDLSWICSIIKGLKIDCLLENIIDIVQNELHLNVVSYSICNKPNKYFVYPSLLIHNQLKHKKKKKHKKGVTIKEENNNDKKMENDKFNYFHIIETYTEILNSWNENNSIFIRIPGFGNYCYLVIFVRSQSNAETYCIVNDGFGNLLYIHNIIINNAIICKINEISAELINKYIQYCCDILPKHLIRIMISWHTQIPINELQLQCNTNYIKFHIVFPRPATTAHRMHIIPKRFEFEIFLNKTKSIKSFSWKCIVKQDTIFCDKHKDLLLFKVNEIFKFDAGINGLIFEYKNNLIIGQFTNICNYCYKLLVVYNILKGFIDYKQVIKQHSAFYRKDFYKLQKIDLISPNTAIQIEFNLFENRTFVLKIEIIWNHIENVEDFNKKNFNPYINNNDYKIKISFNENTIFNLIPNLKLLIFHYFNYRQKYHKKLNILLRQQYESNDDSDKAFDCYEAMIRFKDLIGIHVKKNNKKQQSFIFLQYESLSLMMFLQRLYWSIKTINYLNPFIESINYLNKWFYPKSLPLIQLHVKKYDTLKIMTQHHNNNNILGIHILNENKIGLHIIDCDKGWQLTLNEIDFIKLANSLLKHIENYLLLPQKQQSLSAIFNSKNTKNNSNLNINFCCLNNSNNNTLIHHILSLLNYEYSESKSQLGLKNKNESPATAVTLYSFQALIKKYLHDTYPKYNSNSNSLQNIQFISDVMNAYFNLYYNSNINTHLLYNGMKIESFLSITFLSLMNFVNVNHKTQNQRDKTKQIPQIAKSILSIQELFSLYYDEMSQLALFGNTSKIKELLTNINLNNVNYKLSANNIFWYNLHHINDSHIIFDKNALCVKIHFAEICEKNNTNKNVYNDCNKMPSPSVTVPLSPRSTPSNSQSGSPTPPRKTSSRRYKKHNVDVDDDDDDEFWAFEKYELKNNLFLNIGIELAEENNFSQIFFYQNYQRRSNKYRKISIGFLSNLNKFVESINCDLKQNGYLGSLIISFFREFVNRLSEIKKNDEKEFNRIWKQLQKISQ